MSRGGEARLLTGHFIRTGSLKRGHGLSHERRRPLTRFKSVAGCPGLYQTTEKLTTMEPENHASLGHRPDNNPAASDTGSKIANILDVVAKLVAAGAIVAATVIANNFQSSMTTANLLSQREQADSSLRAAMFHDLIGPIVGSEKSGGDIPVDRQRLVVELLALNFHEHFELKPVMMHIDERLAHEEIPGMDQSQRENARVSLRSVARRVLQSQLAMLTKAENPSPREQQACVYRLEIEEQPPQIAAQTPPLQPCSTIASYFDNLITVPSPNGAYILAFTIEQPDWRNQSFQVLMQITSNGGSEKSQMGSADNDFLLTWFDFPFTDNTLLADGTRFSLVIDDVRLPQKRAVLKLVWFSQDYFSARERPTNYREFREKLGLDIKD